MVTMARAWRERDTEGRYQKALPDGSTSPKAFSINFPGNVQFYRYLRLIERGDFLLGNWMLISQRGKANWATNDKLNTTVKS